MKGEQLGFCYHPGNSLFCPCHSLRAWYAIRLLIRELKQILYPVLKRMWHQHSGQCWSNPPGQGTSKAHPSLSEAVLQRIFLMAYSTLLHCKRQRTTWQRKKGRGKITCAPLSCGSSLPLERCSSLRGSFWFVLRSFNPLFYWYCKPVFLLSVLKCEWRFLLNFSGLKTLKIFILPWIFYGHCEKFPGDWLSPFSGGQKSGSVLSSSADMVHQAMFLLKAL